MQQPTDIGSKKRCQRSVKKGVVGGIFVPALKDGATQNCTKPLIINLPCFVYPDTSGQMCNLWVKKFPQVP